MTQYVEINYVKDRKTLLEWRKRYAFNKKIYPSKVIKNCFYDLYTLDALWKDKEISQLLKRNKILYSNIEDAIKYVVGKYREIQISYILPKLDELMKDEPLILQGDYTRYIPVIDRAEKGSNNEVEEIEYSYISYGNASALVQTWMGLCLTGVEKELAREVITMMEIENNRFDIIEDVFQSFFQASCYYLANLKGGYYKKLPDYW
jgi:hypothetical protein